MTLGMILLVLVAVLIFAGVAERVLDRLRLSDKAAIAIIIAIVVSTIFIPNINITENVGFNVGGFIIPVALAIYLFVKAETGKEKLRAVAAALIGGIIIYGTQRYILPAEPEAQAIDPNYVYAIIAGLVGYILGRSRRAAFIAGVGGVVVADAIQMTLNAMNNVPAATIFGGAGGVDTTVIAGILGVLLAEIIGETRERLQGGTAKKDMHFEKGHFASSLGEGEEKKDKSSDEGNPHEKRGEDDEK